MKKLNLLSDIVLITDFQYLSEEGNPLNLYGLLVQTDGQGCYIKIAL